MTLSAATLAVNGGYGQSTTNGTSFNAPLSVIVTDGNGNPVVGHRRHLHRTDDWRQRDVLGPHERGRVRGQWNAQCDCGHFVHGDDERQWRRQYVDLYGQHGYWCVRRASVDDRYYADFGYLRRGKSVIGESSNRETPKGR